MTPTVNNVAGPETIRSGAETSETSSAVRLSTRTGTIVARKIHWTVPVLGLLLLVVATMSVWKGYLEERLFPKRWGVVVPRRIYRSGQISRSLIEDVLRQHEISTIIDLNGFNRHNADQQVELAVAQYLEIDHHRFALSGKGTGRLDRYIDAVALLAERERQGRPTLVHCAAGSNRTGGVIAVYRLLLRGDSPRDVLDEMARYDFNPSADPELIEFLNSNMRAFAEALVAKDILVQVPETIPQLNP